MSAGYKILAALLLAAAAVAGFQWYIGGLRVIADGAGYARRDAEQKTEDNEALTNALADVARLNRELEGISHDARKEKDAAVVAAAAAADAGVRLRAAEARIRLGQRVCPGAPAAGGGASADATAGVLAEMQRRLDAAQDRVAQFADESRIAGLACERTHDAVVIPR